METSMKRLELIILLTSTTSGCDSSATLILIINNADTSSQSITACESYVNGMELYTPSLVYIIIIHLQ